MKYLFYDIILLVKYMKIISWNVAGYRSICNKGFKESIEKLNPDIICLQEVKCIPSEIPYIPDGYDMYLYPAKRKGYSGTLVFSKIKPLNMSYGTGEVESDEEGRIITLEYNDFYLINAYVPNSKKELERLDYRLNWENHIREYLTNLDKIKPVIYCGDLNVAHTEMDIKNAKSNQRSAGFTIEERNKFSELLNNGYVDTFRYFHPDEIKYSWWSYLFHAREKNAGWRLDYFVVSNRLIDKINDSYIYNEIIGSDHCPIGIDLKG